MIILYERSAQILINLINSNVPQRISDLQKLTLASNRTIRYDLDHIDDYLSYHDLHKLLRKPRAGVSFVGTHNDKEKVRKLLRNISEYNYVLSQDERVKMIISEFICQKGFVTVEYLSDELMVSRSTINKDLKIVRKKFSKHDIGINFVHRHGLILEGKEKDIRSITAELWLEHVYDNSKIMLYDSKSVDKDFKYSKLIRKLVEDIDIFFIENCVNILERELDIKFSDIAYNNIVIHISVAIKRIKIGKMIILSKQEMQKIRKTREFNTTFNMCKIIECYFKMNFTEDEIGYITKYILGGNLFKIIEDTQGEWVHIQMMTRKIIKLVNDNIIVDISHDWKLFNSLLEHIRPMLNRLKYDISLENPILSNIKNNYTNLFNIVKKSVFPIEEFVKKSINDDEIGYLTIHFGAAIERGKINGVLKPRILIVCNSGIGTSELLSIQVQSMFEVKIVAAVSYRQLQNILMQEEVDMIISTIPISKKIDIKSIVVNPILTDENVRQLNSLFLKSKENKIEIGGLINIIERSCTINDYQKLEKDLCHVFNMKFIKDIKGDDRPMLRDIITEETIDLNVSVTDWEDAVRKGGVLLKKAGAVEHRYIDAMVRTVKEIGPYIVIAEGIAMPHARPEDGALKVGMSLITLDKPIEFGNKEYDPVKLVISFCSTDSKMHLRALSELMVLLEDEEAIKKILESKSKNEVIAIINTISN